MKSLAIMSVLPLMATACVQWELGGGKKCYVGPSYRMLQIMGDDHHDRLYQLRNIDIKPWTCMTKMMNTSYKIDGMPEFSNEDVTMFCNIADLCFTKLEPQIYQSVDIASQGLAGEA